MAGRPRAPETYTTYNLILYERQMSALRRAAHARRISVAALIREMVDQALMAEGEPQSLNLTGGIPASVTKIAPFV